ncbi:MAG TPA: hypothetical protein VLV82_06550 [Candidatus Angelobacter sp.]|nr:hypothetical protein [Candidatus Angelobacter sp.]
MTEERDAAGDAPAGRGEHRWPMALAALGAGVLHQLLPADFTLGSTWWFPVAMGVFLVLLIAGDPGLINRERRWLRVITGLMIALIALGNLFSAVRLVEGIVSNDAFATDAYSLLKIGGIVWATNVIAFALWYWDVDGGGSVRRAVRGAWADPAFVFPEMTMPERVPAHWYPHFADYLALSFYTATAFSPTDVSAIKRWAKMLMVAESIASLVLATLVLAKAIGGIGS